MLHVPHETSFIPLTMQNFHIYLWPLHYYSELGHYHSTFFFTQGFIKEGKPVYNTTLIEPFIFFPIGWCVDKKRASLFTDNVYGKENEILQVWKKSPVVVHQRWSWWWCETTTLKSSRIASGVVLRAVRQHWQCRRAFKTLEAWKSHNREDPIC